jgi:hypothetical protein
MKMRFPLNSMLTAPRSGLVSFSSAPAEVNKLPSMLKFGTKGHRILALALLATFPALTTWITSAKAAGNDNFELAMVIKETTNPYYNATLTGAKIAAKEIGGSPTITARPNPAAKHRSSSSITWPTATFPRSRSLPAILMRLSPP